MKEIAIAIPGYPEMPKTLHNHARGWAEILRHTLGEIYKAERVTIVEPGDDFWDGDPERIDNLATLMCYHGINYRNPKKKFVINIFAGITDEIGLEIVKRFQLIERLRQEGRCQSLEYPFPDYSYSANHKANYLTRTMGHTHELSHHLEDIRATCEQVPLYDIWKVAAFTLRWSTLCIGDSHVGASWEPRSICLKNDTETLNGVLNRGLWNKINGRLGCLPSSVKKGIFHYGNIDVRHHLCRLFSGKESLNAAEKLVRELARQVEELGLEEVVLVEPYPIENPSRKMSKSLLYDGQPFWGSWEDRNRVRLHMSDIMREEAQKREGWSTHSWDPHVYCNEKGELDFAVMERPKSIHINPHFYRWDLIKNEENRFGEDSCSTLSSFLD